MLEEHLNRQNKSFKGVAMVAEQQMSRSDGQLGSFYLELGIYWGINK